MTIKVEVEDRAHMLPICVRLCGVRPQRFTKKAAMELKNKLEAALSDIELFEAMEGVNDDGSIDHQQS